MQTKPLRALTNAVDAVTVLRNSASLTPSASLNETTSIIRLVMDIFLF